MDERDDKGKFLPGKSGNLAGRPKLPKDLKELKVLARTHTHLAIETLARVAGNSKSPPAARVAASEALLARGWGRPAADLEGGEQILIKVVRFADQQLEQPEIKTIEHDDDRDSVTE